MARFSIFLAFFALIPWLLLYFVWGIRADIGGYVLIFLIAPPLIQFSGLLFGILAMFQRLELAGVGVVANLMCAAVLFLIADSAIGSARFN